MKNGKNYRVFDTKHHCDIAVRWNSEFTLEEAEALQEKMVDRFGCHYEVREIKH